MIDSKLLGGRKFHDILHFPQMLLPEGITSVVLTEQRYIQKSHEQFNR
jgi:hypothetical protein